jgi:uracil-DNA glycosylase
MGFCDPGTGKRDDLPPRSECAPAWRQALLSSLTQVQPTLVLDQHAQAYHLGEHTGSVTELVRDWKGYWPARVPQPAILRRDRHRHQIAHDRPTEQPHQHERE